MEQYKRKFEEVTSSVITALHILGKPHVEKMIKETAKQLKISNHDACLVFVDLFTELSNNDYKK